MEPVDEKLAIPEDVFAGVILPLADFATLYRYRYRSGALRSVYLDRIRNSLQYGAGEVLEQLLVAIEHDDPVLFDLILQATPRVNHRDLIQLLLNSSRLHGNVSQILGYLVTNLGSPQIPLYLRPYREFVERQVATDPALLQRYSAPGWCRAFSALLTWKAGQVPNRTSTEYAELLQSYEQEYRAPHGADLSARVYNTLLELARQLALTRIYQCLGWDETPVDESEFQALNDLVDPFMVRVGWNTYRIQSLGYFRPQAATVPSPNAQLFTLYRQRLQDLAWFRTALTALTDPARYEELMLFFDQAGVSLVEYLNFIRYQIIDPEAFVDALATRQARQWPVHRLHYMDELLAELGVRTRPNQQEPYYSHRLHFDPATRLRLAATILWWVDYAAATDTTLPWLVVPEEVERLRILARGDQLD